jgi:hypothetical protein
MLRILLLSAMALLLGAAEPAAAQDPIGSVSRIQGDCAGVLDGASEALVLGASVFLDQVVSTGEAARLEVTFVDGTQLTLGERAEMTLDSFVYDPPQGTGQIHLAVVGAFRFVSGQATKLAETDVAVTTPVATIGIRGTDFWGGPIDEQALGVFLIEGAVSVSNAAGEQVLDTPGQGTNIATPDAAPGPVTIWPQDKVDRAFATVTFQ